MSEEEFLLKEVFYKNKNWEYLHDVLLEFIDFSPDILYCENIFIKLNRNIKIDALKWGLSDTLVRDNIFTYIEQNKHILLEI